jgi:FlaA1/EpsC-like NDP-sugar epimerase/lipopolysaccharide/colanic/teichoic acid biosynthesis glycosyltransferase
MNLLKRAINSVLKRSFDIFLAVLGIVLFLPFFPLISLLIKLDSVGPIFYLCNRVGKNQQIFKMFKFRTMYETIARVGGSVSPQGDPRVTPIGRFLRRTKINEIPQLINILKGNMTFVGPRPEAPDLAALYPVYAQEVFTVKPGLVGPNQILGRNEEEWYPPNVDPQQYYIETILPQKLPIDLAYVRESSFGKDMIYIFFGLKETLFKAFSWQFVLQNRSQIYLLGCDLLAILLSFGLANILKSADSSVPISFTATWHILPMIVLVRASCFLAFGLYSTLIRYLSYADIFAVWKAVTTGTLILIGGVFLFHLSALSKPFLLIDWLCLTLLMSSLRFVLRLAREWQSGSKDHNPRRRVLIFGAGDAGSLAYQALMAEKEQVYNVIGFLDDDPTKRHKTLHGKKVLGNRFNLETVVKLYQIQEIFLALPSAPIQEMAQIRQTCQHARVPYRTFPTLKCAPMHGVACPPARETFLPKLLEIPNIEMNIPAVSALLRDKNVLVTGAHGALGIELCRQILEFSPAKLVILERYESYLSELMSHLLNSYSPDRIIPILYTPTGIGPIENIFQEYQPHIVIHAAMRKYLPWFDYQLDAITWINYLYTFRLAKQAIKSGCEYFVILSSTAAANHGNPISDSLRAVEIYLRTYFEAKLTRLIILRLCDVLENRGGAVAMLENQIAHQETVTLPCPEAKCQFLSKHVASVFILETLALAAANPGAEGIFVCHHVPSISLLEIARKLATLYGLQLESELPVRFLNVRSSTSEVIPHSPNDNCCVLVPTTNSNISLLLEQYSHEVVKESRRLLHLQEIQENDFEPLVLE